MMMIKMMMIKMMIVKMMMMMSKMPIMPRKDDQEVNIIIVELMTAMVIIDLHRHDHHDDGDYGGHGHITITQKAKINMIKSLCCE